MLAIEAPYFWGIAVCVSGLRFLRIRQPWRQTIDPGWGNLIPAIGALPVGEAKKQGTRV